MQTLEAPVAKILNPDEPVFGFGVACRVAGADPRRATVWLQRDQIPGGLKVSEKRRFYSPWDVLHLAIFARLANLTTAANAARWTKQAVEEFRSLSVFNHQLSEQALATLGRFGLFVWGDTDLAWGSTSIQGIRITLEGALNLLD